MIIKTPRLVLRPFYPSDYVPLAEMCSDIRVMAMALSERPLIGRDFASLIANEFAHSEGEPLGLGTLAFGHAGTVVGFAGVTRCAYSRLIEGDSPDNSDDVEFGFAIEPRFQGKGLAFEIGKAMCAYAIRDLGLSRIVASVNPKNAASLRVLEKLQMREIGTINICQRGIRRVFETQVALCDESPAGLM